MTETRENKTKGKYKLSKLAINRVDLVPAGDNPEAQIMIFKGIQPDLTTNKEKEEENMKTVEELTKEVEDLKKSLKEAQDKAVVDLAAKDAEIAKAKKEAVDSTAALDTIKKEQAASSASEEDIIKGIQDPNARAIAQKSFERAKKAEEIAKGAQDALLVTEITKSVETELPNLKGTVAEKVVLVKACKQSLAPEIFSQLMDLAKAANTVIRESELLKEKGLAGTLTGTEDGNSAEAKLNKIAKSLVETKVCKSMPEAIAKAASDNKELYEEYTKEHKAKAK